MVTHDSAPEIVVISSILNLLGPFSESELEAFFVYGVVKPLIFWILTQLVLGAIQATNVNFEV